MKNEENKKAHDFCAKFNAVPITEITMLLLGCMAGEWTEDEAKRLEDAGYHCPIKEGIATRTNTIVKKIQTKEFPAYLKTADTGAQKLHADLGSILRDAHVEKFLADIESTDDPTRLEYRGRVLFDICDGEQFKYDAMKVIRDDEEIRVRKSCGKLCRRILEDLKSGSYGCEFADTMIEAAKECCSEHMINPDEITGEAVYLGYMPAFDVFYSGWNIRGSETAGSVVLCFKINKDGEICTVTDWREDPMEICDASAGKFYVKSKPTNLSLYESMHRNTGEERKVIDIMLK